MIRLFMPGRSWQRPPYEILEKSLDTRGHRLFLVLWEPAYFQYGSSGGCYFVAYWRAGWTCTGSHTKEGAMEKLRMKEG